MRSRPEPAETDPTRLSLAEMMAMRPRVLRGALPPGARIPGGARVGTRRAQGSDFDGLGPYLPGDDIRRIDWRATARSGKPQVRQYIADAHRARMVVVDDRPDLAFGTRPMLMAKSAALTAAFLIWEAGYLQEAVGLAITSNGATLAPRRGAAWAIALIETLMAAHDRQIDAEAMAGGSSAAEDRSAAGLDAAGAFLRRGDEICMVSDFGRLSDGFLSASRALEPLRDLRAFVIEDPLGTTGLATGSYPVANTEASAVELVRIRSTRDAQAEATAALRKARDRDLERHGWTVFPADSILSKQGRHAS